MQARRSARLVPFLVRHAILSPALLEDALATGGLTLLDEALTHSSAAEPCDHERLEFLGDAVLRLAASEFLRQRQPDLLVGRW